MLATSSSPSITARPAVDPRLVLSLAAVYLVWSSTYLAMRIAIVDLPPLLMASMRYTVAGLVMLAIAKRRGVEWPRAREWLRIAPIGALLCVGGNGFIVVAEQSVSSGGAAVVCGTMPLWVGVLGVVTGERPSPREWLSLALGFGGVFVLMGGPSLSGRPEHVALLICAPICWALGSVLTRRVPATPANRDSFMLPAMQLLTGGSALALVGGVSGEHLPVDAGARSWLALAYLCIFGSLVAFTAYSWLLRNTRPAIATSYAYVNPILAVLIGAVVSGEALGWTTLVANVMIVAAVMLVLRRPRAA